MSKRTQILSKNVQAQKRARQPIQLFAEMKGYYLMESNKVIRIYERVRSSRNSREPLPVFAPVKVCMSEWQTIDWLMLQPTLNVDRTVPLSLEGMTSEERDAAVVEMMNK